MRSHNLKSICSMQKMKQCDLVERPKFKFDRASIQKQSHGIKTKFGKSVTYVLKNVGKYFQTTIRWVRLVLCVTRSRM